MPETLDLGNFDQNVGKDFLDRATCVGVAVVSHKLVGCNMFLFLSGHCQASPEGRGFSMSNSE